MANILEHLEGVRDELFPSIPTDLYNTLDTCISLLRKGFIPEADVEEILEQYGTVEQVPNLDSLIASESGDLPHDGITNKSLGTLPQYVRAEFIIGFYGYTPALKGDLPGET